MARAFLFLEGMNTDCIDISILLKMCSVSFGRVLDYDQQYGVYFIGAGRFSPRAEQGVEENRPVAN